VSGEKFMSEIVWSNAENIPVQEAMRGIFVRQLWAGEAGEKAVMVEIAPGAQWDGVDFHQDRSEEVFVVRGVFNDGTRDYSEGTFIHHPVGSSHVPQSKTGCTLFIFHPKQATA
jgi:mannose-6-phosphate isomerase-like protein (cupin superfamily)